MTQSYKPFKLTVHDKDGSIYRVTAEFEGSAPAEGEILAELPLLKEDEKQQAQVWLQEGSFDAEFARDFGSRLFNTLFVGDILKAFRDAFIIVNAVNAVNVVNANGAGLRVVLTVPTDLEYLPWELMYDAKGPHGFLARSTTAPLVRTFADLSARFNPPPKEGPLRILVVSASPKNFPPLNSEEEEQAIAHGLAENRLKIGDALLRAWQYLRNTHSFSGAVNELFQRSLAEIRYLPHATKADIDHSLQEARKNKKPYHVVHFIAHGDIDRDGAALLLESKEDDNGDPISEQAVAEIMDGQTVNLAVFSVCKSAGAFGSFKSVARATLQKNVPAVIGMQVSILDHAAVDLAREFYNAWAAGEPLETSMAYARRLVSKKTTGAAADWGIPVLHMGTSEGLSLQMSLPPRPWLPWLVGLPILVLLLIPSLLAIRSLFPPDPKVMTGAFNVAVADIGEQSGAGQPIRNSESGKLIGDLIFNDLTASVNDDPDFSDLHGLIQLQHENLGPIKGLTPEEQSQAAGELATRINATVLIYGTLDVSKPPYYFVPQFYVTPGLPGGDELTGSSAFGKAIRVFFPLDSQKPTNLLVLADEIEPRSKAFSLFTLGLAYFLINKPDKALDNLKRAEDIGWPKDSSNQEEGKQVIYLFEGSALFMKGSRDDLIQATDVYSKSLHATKIDYTRALIGLGNVYYKQGTEKQNSDGTVEPRFTQTRIDLAITQFQSALSAPDASKAPTAYVNLKAMYNLGLAYATEARNLNQAQKCPDSDAVTSLNQAIAAYKPNSGVSLVRELGAKSYYQLGLLYEFCGDNQNRTGPIAPIIDLYNIAGEAYSQTVQIAQPKQVPQPGIFGLFVPIGAPPPLSLEESWQDLRWHALDELANTYFERAELGDQTLYQQAVDQYQKITTAFENGESSIPDDLAAQVYNDLGLALLRLGENDRAIQSYQRVIEIAPEGLSPRINDQVQKYRINAQTQRNNLIQGHK